MNTHGGKFIYVTCDHIYNDIISGIISGINIIPSTWWGEGVKWVLRQCGTLRLSFENQAISEIQ